MRLMLLKVAEIIKRESHWNIYCLTFKYKNEICYYKRRNISCKWFWISNDFDKWYANNYEMFGIKFDKLLLTICFSFNKVRCEVPYVWRNWTAGNRVSEFWNSSFLVGGMKKITDHIVSEVLFYPDLRILIPGRT